MKRISYITLNPEVSVDYWLGTEYYMAKTLEKHFDVSYITGIKTNLCTMATLRKIFHRKTSYSITRSPEVSKDYAKQVRKRLSADTDIIFSPGTLPLACLDVNKPKVSYTDATFAQMINYYEEASGLAPRTIREGLELEKMALDSASLLFYSSEWAANSAINDYGISPDKVKVIPLGANIDKLLSFEEVSQLVANRETEVCKILFLGVDWYRKRGDLVLEAVRILNEDMGIPAELHIVGIKELPVKELPPYVKHWGFISKAKPGGLEKIEKLIADSHFLFVPSKMEAYGLVFCEAMSFGVPCISSKTGGILTIIKNGLNGAILDVGSPAREYAIKISELFKDKKLYRDLSMSAFDDFSHRLNWNVADEKMKQYLNEL